MRLVDNLLGWLAPLTKDMTEVPDKDISLLVLPDVETPILRAKLAKGMGHNGYGEIAWPNDLLYMFPVCILGVLGLSISLAVIYPTEWGEVADPFATPLEILPEWFLLPTFQILRALPNKVLGILGMSAVPAGLLCVPVLEGINPFCNPFRRPGGLSLFITGWYLSCWLGAGSLQEL